MNIERYSFIHSSSFIRISLKVDFNHRVCSCVCVFYFLVYSSFAFVLNAIWNGVGSLKSIDTDRDFFTFQLIAHFFFLFVGGWKMILKSKSHLFSQSFFLYTFCYWIWMILITISQRYIYIYNTHKRMTTRNSILFLHFCFSSQNYVCYFSVNFFKAYNHFDGNAIVKLVKINKKWWRFKRKSVMMPHTWVLQLQNGMFWCVCACFVFFDFWQIRENRLKSDDSESNKGIFYQPINDFIANFAEWSSTITQYMCVVPVETEKKQCLEFMANLKYFTATQGLLALGIEHGLLFNQ